MAIKTATITVDADLAKAWNAAPAAKRKKLQVELKSKSLNGASAQKEVGHFSKKESALLLQINQNLPRKQRERLRELIDRLEFESITDKEQAELLKLTDKAEQLQAERLRTVSALAKLRGVSVEQVMKQLGIKPRKYVRGTNS